MWQTLYGYNVYIQKLMSALVYASPRKIKKVIKNEKYLSMYRTTLHLSNKTCGPKVYAAVECIKISFLSDF
jgi:hypothetical protein